MAPTRDPYAAAGVGREMPMASVPQATPWGYGSRLKAGTTPLLSMQPWSAELQRQAAPPPPAQFVFVTGAVAGAWDGSAAACGVRPTTAVSRPWLQSCFAAVFASSSVTALTISLRFSM